MKNFKIKCVSNYSGYFTKGKIYNIIDGRVTSEGGTTWFGYDSIDRINEDFESKFELVVEPKYPLGTKLKIINAGSGAMGCNGCEGIVTDKPASNGWCRDKTDGGVPVFNVEILRDTYGEPFIDIWGVREDGEYEVLDKTIILSDKNEDYMTIGDTLNQLLKSPEKMFRTTSFKGGDYFTVKVTDMFTGNLVDVKFDRVNEHGEIVTGCCDAFTRLNLKWFELKTVELTLDEIAEKFGVKVENLKINK